MALQMMVDVQEFLINLVLGCTDHPDVFLRYLP
jgi:hypothetical protein